MDKIKKTILAPKTAVVSMARNEKKRTHDTMRHFCALFDFVLVIDHGSTDGTGDIVKAYDGCNGTAVNVLRSLDEGYFQEEYMTACAKAILHAGIVDWIFFLDFDEFLPFKSRDAFNSALVMRSADPVISMCWRNVVLTEEFGDSLFGISGETASKPSRFEKTAINVNAMPTSNFVVSQGNHHLVVDDKIFSPIHRSFSLVHVPICDPVRFRSKIQQGVAAYKATSKSVTLGSHWREIYKSLDEICSNKKLLNEITFRYSEPLDAIMSDVAIGKFTEDTLSINLNFAHTHKIDTPAKTTSHHPEFTLKNINVVLGKLFPSRRTAEEPPFFKPLCETLPSRSSDDLCVPLDLLSTIMSVAEPHKQYNPAPKIAYLPFLKGIISAASPRRYVEVNADSGASLVCAASWVGHKGGEALGVGLWEGMEDELSRLTEFIEHDFHGLCRIIRSDKKWISMFEPGSIDMLVIRNVHATNELKQLIELTRPLLAAKCIIIIYDLLAPDGDPCSFDYFDELAKQASASLSFYHAKGLGVLAYGYANKDLPIRFLDLINSAPWEFERIFMSMEIGAEDWSRYMLPEKILDWKLLYEVVVNSRSWRVTSPIRKVFNIARKIRNVARRHLNVWRMKLWHH